MAKSFMVNDYKGEDIMIVTNRCEHSIVNKLEKSEHTFYLTGSRFFGGYSIHSDWDYFVKDSLGVRGFLLRLGFQEEENLDLKMYDDSTIVTVMSFNDIQIQLVHDADFKHQVQTLLLQVNGLKGVPKTARKYVWNYAISLHRLGNEQQDVRFPRA
jgi:hypothetical protein